MAQDLNFLLPFLLQVASSLAQVVRAQAQGVRTTVAHVTLPSSAGIITSQVRTAVTSGTQVVITSAGTGSQARTTPAGTALTGMNGHFFGGGVLLVVVQNRKHYLKYNIFIFYFLFLFIWAG